ncbi:hypothetical protein [Sulfurimonas sp.]|uniref:hypothetical protein n=1 Tax=Sulfurimonas sp. TaxID=2022749 RepID=UPI002B45A166|nr:hypothetical protein [Sulfurimonas sp.]
MQNNQLTHSYLKEPIRNYLIIYSINIQVAKDSVNFSLRLLSDMNKDSFNYLYFYNSLELRKEKLKKILNERKEAFFVQKESYGCFLPFIEWYHFVRTGYIMSYKDLIDIYPKQFKFHRKHLDYA